MTNSIKYYSVNNNPNHQVWAKTKEEASLLAPESSTLTYLYEKPANRESKIKNLILLTDCLVNEEFDTINFYQDGSWDALSWDNANHRRSKSGKCEILIHQIKRKDFAKLDEFKITQLIHEVECDIVQSENAVK